MPHQGRRSAIGQRVKAAVEGSPFGETTETLKKIPKLAGQPVKAAAGVIGGLAKGGVERAKKFGRRVGRRVKG